MDIRGSLYTAGRIVMGACFVIFGLTKLLAIGGTIGFIAKTGLPFPSLAFWFSVVFETVLGLALIVGIRIEWAAGALAAWCLLTGVIFHHEIGKRDQRDQLLKNIVMAAAFAQLARRKFPE